MTAFLQLLSSFSGVFEDFVLPCLHERAGSANVQSCVPEGIFGAPKEPHEVPSFPFCPAGVGYSDRGTNSSTEERFFFCYPLVYLDLHGLLV